MSWAATASAVAGVSGSLISNAMNNSKGGQTGQTVYNFNDPQDQAMRQQSQGFMSDALQGLKNGQGPAWMNNTLNPMQNYLMQQNQQQMFGMPGNAGGSIADVAQSQGAAMGLGGAAAMAPMNDALAQYGQRMNGINQYIQGLRYNTMNSEASQFPNQLYQTAAPRNQLAYNSIPGTNNTGPNLNLQGLSPMLAQGLGKMFNPSAPASSAWGSDNSANLQNYSAYGGNSVPGVSYMPSQQVLSNPNNLGAWQFSDQPVSSSNGVSTPYA